MHFDIRVCMSCNGTGSKDGVTHRAMGTVDIMNKPDLTCSTCGGFGWKAKPVDDTFSMVENTDNSYSKWGSFVERKRTP